MPCGQHCAACRATPPHPEYLSGHQAAVWAIADTLVRTLGKDDVTFSFTSESTPWITRTYKSITAAAKEVGGARCKACRVCRQQVCSKFAAT
jgi:hypothetical protein